MAEGLTAVLQGLSARTQLATSSEPDPLSSVASYTFSSLDVKADKLIQQIDDVLYRNRFSNLVARAERYQTQLRQETRLIARTYYKDTFYVLEHHHDQAQEHRPENPARQLELRLRELQRWLGVGLDVVASAAGLNRGTIYAWRRRSSSPRPATTGAVLRLHALVKTAVATAGEDAAQAFFRSGDPAPLDQLVAAGGSDAAFAQTSKLMRRSLVRPALPSPNPLMAATVSDDPPRSLG